MTYYGVYYNEGGYGDLLETTDSFEVASTMVKDALKSFIDNLDFDDFKEVKIKRDTSRAYGFTVLVTDNDDDTYDYDAYITLFEA